MALSRVVSEILNVEKCRDLEIGDHWYSGAFDKSFSTDKVVSESLATWATYMPILVFLDLYVIELGPTYATDR